ncbi:hypothetical protein ACVW1C_002246 [Bradyrhizobium sp. USDA 4011]
MKALAQTHLSWTFNGVDPANEMLKVAAKTLGTLTSRVVCLPLSRYVAFAIASGVDTERAQAMRGIIEANLNMLNPEQDEAILREAGFSNICQFYAAFTWRGWVAHG